MLSNDTETVLSDLFHKNQNIQTVCLLNSIGTFSVFLNRSSVDEAEKKRLAASIMASVVLAERSIMNLVQEHVKHLVIRGENAKTIIFITNSGNYLYVLSDNDFNDKILFDLDFKF